MKFNCDNFSFFSFSFKFFYLKAHTYSIVHLFVDSSIVRADKMFNNLYTNDTGVESPNLANKFLLSKFGYVSSLYAYMRSSI